MCCRLDFNSVLASLPCCFLKDPLKGELLDIDLTTFLGVRNFANTSAMSIIFVLEMFKI